MEFDEMRKIWDSQNNEMVFAINEQALHRRVKAKKKSANRVVNWTEKGLMIINSITGTILLLDAILDEEGFWDYAGAGALFFTVIYLLFIRRRRMKLENKFDRSMLGELNHAISITKSTINIISTMIWWYFTPLIFFFLAKMIANDAPIESWLLIIGSFGLAFILVNWEKKNCHIPRKEHLEKLKEKLLMEER